MNKAEDLKLIVPESPSHVVIETKDKFTIDDFELDFVLQNGVTVQKLSKDIVKVNVSFLAKSYGYEIEEIIDEGQLSLTHPEVVDRLKKIDEFSTPFLEALEPNLPHWDVSER